MNETQETPLVVKAMILDRFIQEWSPYIPGDKVQDFEESSERLLESGSMMSYDGHEILWEGDNVYRLAEADLNTFCWIKVTESYADVTYAMRVGRVEWITREDLQ